MSVGQFSLFPKIKQDFSSKLNSAANYMVIRPQAQYRNDAILLITKMRLVLLKLAVNKIT